METKKSNKIRNLVIGVLASFVLICCCLGYLIISAINTKTPIPNATRFQNTKPPTLEKTPSLAPSPTLTHVPTFTYTPSLTLEPLTQTANALNQTATKKAENATATKNAAIINATATANQASKRSTGTAQAKSRRATQIAQYTKISAKELVTYPDSHSGEMIVIRGRVFNVNSNKEFQIWIDGLNHEAVYIVMNTSYSDIFEDDYVTIYGIVFGQNCGTNAFGGQVCQPVVMGDFYEKK